MICAICIVKKDKTLNRFCVSFFSLSGDDETLINLIHDKIVPFIMFFCPIKYQYLNKLVRNLILEQITNFTYASIRTQFPNISDEMNIILLCAHVIACIVNPNTSTLDDSSIIQPPLNNLWLPKFELSKFLNLIFYLVMERELFYENGIIKHLTETFQDLSSNVESEEDYGDDL